MSKVPRSRHKCRFILTAGEELTVLVEKLHGTAEVLRDLETATQHEVTIYEDQ